MTPKQKAQELVNKYISTYHGDEEGYVSLTNHKKAAIICVEEIIKASPSHDTLPDVTSIHYDEVKEAIRYWSKVKEELQKL